MTRHSAGNLIFLLVFALLCGDWAEPAKARAAVGGHKALSKLLPASSKVSTDNILLAQARKGNNGNGQGGGTCNNDNNNQNQSGQDCGDLNSGVSGAAEEPTGQPIVNADQVDVYELPDEYKVILPAKDGKTFFGISYSMWSKPGDYPGISYGQWYQESKKTGKFFPWRGNPELAQNLSSNYKIYAQSRLRDKLNEDGDILLYGYDNGGGFVYGDFNKGQSPEGSLNRPDVTESGNSQGLLYFHNGVSHFTVGVQGGGGRIQAFGGCEVNTISKDKNVSTSRILPKDDLCRWDGNQVSSDYYVPLLDGGELFADKSKGSNIELSNQLFVTDKGGTIDNNGVNLILEGSIQSIGDISDAPSPLFFEGPGSTSLQGNNFYINPTTVKKGVLEITNVNGLGSTDAGTRVEESAVLRISLSGKPTSQGSPSNDAKINEKITLTGGEIDLNGNYIDLKGGVVLEGEGVNSTIRVKDGSTEVFARSIISGDGGLIKDGEGFLRLGGRGPQTYEGETIIEAGELRFADSTSTPKTTHVTVKEGATLRLMGENEVSSIEGSGRIFLQDDGSALTVNVESGSNPDFEGSIRDPRDDLEGTFIKDGEGSLTLSGKNAYGSLIVEGGQLDINSEAIVTGGMKPSEASVSLRLGHDLSVKTGSALRVTGRDLDPMYGPRTPGEETSSEGTIAKIANHASPIIEFDDSINELTVENGSLLVASFTGALPTDYEAYKDNCKIGADPKTCYSISPQILFKDGDDTLTNNGLIVGPAEGNTGNHLQLRFQGGNDTLNNGLSEGNDRRSGSWLGCVTAGADVQGFNGYRSGNTCDLANEKTGGNLPDANSNDVYRNYTVNVYMGGGNDAFTNHQESYLRGNFYGEGGDDILGNQGVIRGNIVMGKGRDTVNFQGGNAENDGASRGLGVLDDRLALGTTIKIENDNSPETDVNKLNLFGNAVVSYRNSLGWGVQEGLENCGGKKSTTGRSDYGCRWDDGGYNYSAIIGSNGEDNIWVKKKSDGTQAVQIWGSVELGASNDSLRLQNYDLYGADLHLVGDLDLGTGDSQTIVVEEQGDFSVRAIRGDNIDFQISGLATLGGDSELGVFAADRDVDLKQGNTLSSYTGTTTINKGGTLRAGQAWSLSSESIHQVDGTLILGDNDNRREDQEIGELTGNGLVSLQNQSYLFYGGLNGDVEFSGKSEGNGALIKKGSGTTSFSGTFGHTGLTKVHDGTLLLQEDESLSEKSTVLISSSTKQPTLDLGDTTQSAPAYNLHGGTLKNGIISSGEINVERRTNNVIDEIKGEPVSVKVSSRNAFEEEVGLTFMGSSKLESLEIDRATVLIDESASVELSGNIIGGDFVSRGAAFELSDKLDIQGSLTVGGSIDLDAGNDLIRIGNRASVSSGVIDGGSGDFDVFWNQNGSLDFDTSNVKGFEIISYKGEGLAYLGDKASLIVTAAERDIDDSLYTEYGLIASTPSNNTLNFSSNSNAKNIESGLTVGLLQLDGDSTIHLRQGSLDIAALQSNSKGKTNKFVLGEPLEVSAEAPLQSLRESLVRPGSGVDLDQVASGRLSVGASDQSIASIDQRGGLWSYEGDFSSTSLSGQGVVVVGNGSNEPDSQSSATFESLTADGSRRLLVGARKDGVLKVAKGIHDSWSPDSKFLNAKKASLISNGEVVLGVSGGNNPSTYKGLTVAMKGGSITTLENDAIGPQSPTLVRGLLQIGESEGSGVSQNFARRLIVGQTGSLQNGDLSITSLANAGEVQIDSLTINNGMKRLLDVLADRRELKEDAPIRKIKAQGSLKNLGGSIEIAGELKYQDNDDATDGHALINSRNLRDVIQYLNSDRRGDKPQPGTLTAQKITMGKNRDIISNSGIIATTTRDADETSINLGGGNDLILNRGSFDIGESIIDGGEPLKITGSIFNRDTRKVEGLNIFRQGYDRLSIFSENPTSNLSGLVESQLVNFAAIKLEAGGDWIFPQGNDCRVTGKGRIFSEDKTDCVGIVGQREKSQFLKITNGAIVETGVMELGRSSTNSIEVLDGSLTAGLIDGVIGSERINVNSGDITFDRTVNNSFNSLVVGDNSSSASVNAQAIHNIASINVVNGSLDADLLHATDLEDLGQDPELRIGAPVDPGSISLDGSTSLVEQISSNAVKGSLKVDETEGYSKALQLSGMWGYEGDFGDIDLDSQGIVTTTRSADDTSIKDDDEQDDIDEVTFKSISAAGDRRLLVGARQDGKLTILEGLHDSSLTEISNKAAILNNGEMVLGDVDLESDQTPSTYRGATVVMKDGSLQTLYNDAISLESPTLVRGRLSIGDQSTGEITQNFAKRLLVGNTGRIENGALSVTSLTNAGDVQIDSLTVNNGMKRLLDVLANREALAEDSPLRKIKAQGSLKNLGGNFEIAGDLIYQDNKDATAGHALINARNLRDVVNYEKNERNGAVPQPGTLAASRIMMGSNNDVILNSGIISTTTRDEGKTSINLRGGNDLILNRGTFDIGESIIDGGEELVLELDKTVQGLNIFRQGVDPRSDSSDNSSGLEETQLVNFAAIKLDAGGDWIFPQGQDCQVRGDQKVFSAELTQCVGITGGKEKDQEIVITDGARVEAGVVALGRDSTNTIRVEEGSLRAVLIEGGNELRQRFQDSRGSASNDLPVQKETIVLGESNSDADGELIVGGIVDVEAIHQLGGTWSYAVNASSDNFGVFPDTMAAGTIKVKTTDLSHDLKGTTSVSRATFQRIDGESNDLSIEVDSNAFLGVIDGIHGANTSLTTKGEVSLSGESSYGGDTIIQDGAILYAENNSALSEKSSVVIEKDGLLDLQGFDNTIASLSGSGELVLNPRTSTIQNSDDEVKGANLVIKAGDFAGTIDDGSLSGLGSVTKISDAHLTLSGFNTYSSPTFIKGGTLKVTGSLSDSTAVTVESGATYDVDSTDTIRSLAGAGSVDLATGIMLMAGGDNSSTVFLGTMSGDGGFEKAGTGTTTFGGANTYTGATNIKGGTLKVTGSLGDSTAVTVESGATYDVDSSDTIGSLAGAGSVDLATGIMLTAGGDNSSTVFLGTMSGDGGFEKAGTGTTTFGVANTYMGATNIKGGTLKVTGSLSDSTAVTVESGATYDVDSSDTIGSLAGAGSVDLATGIMLTAGGDNSSTVFLGTMSGDGGFEKAGTGTTTFGGANTYTGATNIKGGTLKVTGSLGDSTAVTLESGATYDVDSSDTIGSLAGAGSVDLATGIMLTAGGDNSSTVFLGTMSGDGGFEKAGTGTTTFGGANTYTGATNIKGGTLKVTGSLGDSTAVTVESGATYDVDSSDTIGSLAGAGSVDLATGIMLTAGGDNSSTVFLGTMSGDGGFEKAGTGTTTFGGANTYMGATNVQSGRLTLADISAIDQLSSTVVNGTGQLDLYTYSANDALDRGKEFKINQVEIAEGGQLFVSARNPLVAESISLDANSSVGSINPGGFVVEIFEKTDGRERNKAPIRVQNSFVYKSGSLVVKAPFSDDPEGVWNIIDGEVENADELADETYLVTVNRSAYEFQGVNVPIYGPAMYKGYLEDGSLNLIIEAKTPQELQCQVDPNDCSIDLPSPDPGSPSNDLPIQLPSPEGPQVGNELPDVDGDVDGDGLPDVLDPDDDNDGIPDNKDPDGDGDGELDQLPGCDVGDDLCDVISDIDGDEDEASIEEEEAAGEVIEAVLDGLEDEEIDLPLSFDYGQLARLIGSGLAPRNVDAAGRAMALYNNLLVDAVFDRQPLRQFEELLVSDEVVEESVVGEEALIEDAALEEVVETEEVAIELDGVSFVDQEDDELDLAKRDGVSAWVKGYGGNSRADDSGILYNDYDLNAYGTSFGVDVALSETFQIGAFANYGDLNVNHRSGDTGGGSWNPEGWGGGLTAQYSARNFYVQGLLGASEFSGEQSRNILQINDQFGGNTTRGDKTVTSYLGALRLGAPFKTGGVVLEPQAQAVWTHNREHGFSETSGSEKNLRLKYKDRTTNFMETELGMKLSVPIRTGERGLLVPSVRAAWLADWNRENEGQEIGYKFTKKTATFDSELDTHNGALIEAGLDYTIQNFNSTSVKVYARGGMELWDSDRGTTWRGSGGVTFQF